MRKPFKSFGFTGCCLHCGGSGEQINRVEVGQWVRGYRLRFNLTATKVSRILGISTSYYCDLEHGRKNWNKELFNRVCEVIERG